MRSPDSLRYDCTLENLIFLRLFRSKSDFHMLRYFMLLYVLALEKRNFATDLNDIRRKTEVSIYQWASNSPTERISRGSDGEKWRPVLLRNLVFDRAVRTPMSQSAACRSDFLQADLIPNISRRCNNERWNKHINQAFWYSKEVLSFMDLKTSCVEFNILEQTNLLCEMRTAADKAIIQLFRW